MTVKPFTTFTTGPSIVPDVGVLSYNGCVFSPLFLSNVSGRAVEDDARRTIKLMEYEIVVDGYVTLPAGDSSTSPTMSRLRSLLNAQGGSLSYQGRGNDIVVNIGDSDKDAAWGPVPKILEFQPLGGGLSAKVKWTAKVHVVEPQPSAANAVGGAGARAGGVGPIQFFKGPINPGPAQAKPFQAQGKGGGGGGPGKGPDRGVRMLQFNYESGVTYSDDGYSTLTNRGILEIPLTRDPSQSTRTFKITSDFLRGEIERRIMSGIDLKQFRPVRRTFSTSRDKRVLTWDFAFEEKKYMDLPLACMGARGSFTCRPARSGMGMASWMCTLRATYTVRADRPRRLAWFAFLALLRHRMEFSEWGNVEETPARRPNIILPPQFSPSLLTLTSDVINLYKTFFKSQEKKVVDNRKAWLMDFSVEEGLYQDSGTVTFSATWKLMTTFSHILLASGLWSRVEGKDRSLWATTIKEVAGVQSWIPNIARTDIIVDFGGG